MALTINVRSSANRTRTASTVTSSPKTPWPRIPHSVSPTTDPCRIPALLALGSRVEDIPDMYFYQCTPLTITVIGSTNSRWKKVGYNLFLSIDTNFLRSSSSSSFKNSFVCSIADIILYGVGFFWKKNVAIIVQILERYKKVFHIQIPNKKLYEKYLSYFLKFY